MAKIIIWIARLFIILIPLIVCGQSESNKLFTLTGLLEKKDGSKSVFEEVYLYEKDNNVLKKTELTDAQGRFTFLSISGGFYYIQVEVMGKLTIVKEFEIRDNTDLGLVLINQNAQELKEVVIEKKKPFVERKLDKLVINVENSIASAGSNVLETLQKSPGVLVQEESGIQLKGKSGVVIMIDGKPSPLSGADLTTYLKSIPASSVQNIEIITNPSAKFDAAGNGGIINIRLKKDKNIGFNGSLSLVYGQGVYSKPSANTNFNYRNSKLNLFGNYSYSNPLHLTNFFINRKFFDENRNVSAIFEQNSFTKQPVSSHNTKFGVDYFVSDKTVFGVLFNGNWNNVERNGNTNATITDGNGVLDYTTQTNIQLDESRFNGVVNANFKHNFDASKELTADVDYGKFDSNTVQNIKNSNYDPLGILLANSKLLTDQIGGITIKSIKSDYVFSKENSKMEFGAKSSIVSSDNDVKFYNIINDQNTLDPTRSNHFLYDENINAVYFSKSNSIKKWSYQLGLRMENTNTKGKQIATNESFSRKYTNFFPNMVISNNINDHHAVSFTYSKRIDRPTYRQLNPFKIFVDSYTYVVGDPTLNSVLTNLFEINYTLNGKYVTTLSYTKSKESITDIFVQDDITKISYQIPANIQDYEQYNLGVFIPFGYKKILNSTLSSSVYYNKYISPLQTSTLQQSFTSWDANLTNNFSFGKGWSAELTAFYQSKMVWGLFYIKNLAQVSTGVQYVTKDKNTIFKLSLSDIFLTNHIAVEVNYLNQDFYTDRTWDSRVLSFSFTKKFGKSSVAKARQRNGGVDDEKRRAG